MTNESLTITSRAETAFCGLEDIFNTMYCRKDFERIMESIRCASESAKTSRYLPLLYGMLDDCNIEYEYGMSDDYYAALIEKNISSSEYDGEMLEDRMVLALFDRFQGYSTPSEYMNRILVRLQDEDDQKKWCDCSLRLRILKQFIKYGNYLDDAGYGSRATIEKYAAAKTGKKKKELNNAEIADVVSEDIFKDFDKPCEKEKKDTYENQRKPGGVYGLLKLCDDLAYGKFRTQGGTKKGIYFLAMVLNMRLTGFPGANEENDIMKNMFRDYYTNNLMRYMTEAYKGHMREFENPSGLGINFKNFAEMVYLFYISKADMDALEKIVRSCKMIDELSEAVIKDNPNVERKEKKPTEVFRRHFVRKDAETGVEIFSEDILNLPEEEFKAFLLKNYNCDTRTDKNSVIGVMQIDIDQNTAYKEYNKILEELIGELEKREVFDNEKKKIRKMSLDDCNYGLWFVDVSAYEKEGIAKFPDRYPEIDRVRFDAFMDVLLGANHLIGNTVKEMPSDKDEEQEHLNTSKIRIKALSISKPEDITRTSLMVAFYYLFNILHEENGQFAWTGYKDLFEEYKWKLDPILETCGYQEISGKNLFDVILTFSSYARLVL